MMKRVNSLMIGALGALMAVAVAPAAVAGISATKHNLGSSQTLSVNKTTATAEICVFCHTPHASNTDAPVPLWNRKLGGQSYSMYSSSTLDAAQAPMSASPSLACLSCHDGSQAMDSVINQPGSGGYNAAGARMSPTNWTGATVSNGSGAGSGVLQAGITLIGTDLRNDHPVSIQYGGGIIDAAKCKPSCASGAGSFKDQDFQGLSSSNINGTDYWWVERGGAGRQRTDLILYTRTDGLNSTGAEPFVECATCHDPHVSDKPTFLRVDNAGSNLCLACHIK